MIAIVEVRRIGRLDFMVRLADHQQGASATWTLRGSGHLGSSAVRIVSVDLAAPGDPLDLPSYEALAGAAGFVVARKALDEHFPPSRRHPRLSDPPEFWLSERRGRDQPKDVHYAQLAVAYAATKAGRRRRELPKRWAEEFGGSEKAWRHRLTRARQRYMLGDDDEPTLAALEEVYGPDVIGLDRVLDRALDDLRIAKDGLTSAEADRVRRQGITVGQYRDDARKRVRVFFGERIPPREQATQQLKDKLGDGAP